MGPVIPVMSWANWERAPAVRTWVTSDPFWWAAADVPSIPRITVKRLPDRAVTSRISSSIRIRNWGSAGKSAADRTLNDVDIGDIPPPWFIRVCAPLLNLSVAICSSGRNRRPG
jgi:hypothetical protein